MPTFASFMMAGFECNYAHVDRKRRLDLLHATKHDLHVRLDYELLKGVGISVVREGFSWHGIDKGGGKYDFSRYTPLLRAGRDAGIQQIWDLNHFDYPARLDPFSADFVEAFAQYAHRAVEELRKFMGGTIYVVPINEISFSAWIGADKGSWYPYQKGRGSEFKRQLVRAVLAGMQRIRNEDRNIRFIHTDPFMQRKARFLSDRLAVEKAASFNTVARYEAWDMIAGKMHPEFGGDPGYLDIIGVNYYYHNQEWVRTGKDGTPQYVTMPWNSSGRVSFSELLAQVIARYDTPIIISETGSHGTLRRKWWRRVFKEIDSALTFGFPIYGICAYPVLDRPDNAGYLLPRSGLWDFSHRDTRLRRVPYAPALSLVKKYVRKQRVWP